MICNVEYTDSYYTKTNPETYSSAFEEVIGNVTEEAMNRFKDECPVRTGNLRDSHEFEVSGLEGRITNSAEYWVYVVYGTSRMSANDYPQRAVNSMISEDYISKTLNEVLSDKGVL